MEKLDWSTWPAEIIKLILSNIISEDEKHLECCTINKNWYNASLSVLYHSICIRQEHGESDDTDEEGGDSDKEY